MSERSVKQKDFYIQESLIEQDNLIKHNSTTSTTNTCSGLNAFQSFEKDKSY